MSFTNLISDVSPLMMSKNDYKMNDIVTRVDVIVTSFLRFKSCASKDKSKQWS